MRGVSFGMVEVIEITLLDQQKERTNESKERRRITMCIEEYEQSMRRIQQPDTPKYTQIDRMMTCCNDQFDADKALQCPRRRVSFGDDVDLCDGDKALQCPKRRVSYGDDETDVFSSDRTFSSCVDKALQCPRRRVSYGHEAEIPSYPSPDKALQCPRRQISPDPDSPVDIMFGSKPSSPHLRRPLRRISGTTLQIRPRRQTSREYIVISRCA